MGDILPMANTRTDFQPLHVDSKNHSKKRALAPIPKIQPFKSLKCIALGDQSIFSMGAAAEIGWFILKLAALEAVRRVSKAHCPFVWRGIQAIQFVCYPPLKWIQKWAPFKGLVSCIQNLSKPLLVLSIATSLPDLSTDAQQPSIGSENSEPWNDAQREFAADSSIPDRSVEASEKWILKVFEELDKEGLTLPERINKDELWRHYKAAHGDLHCFLPSIKKTVRWREKFIFLTPQELEAWSDMVFWHGRDVKGRPCLFIRLGLACSAMSSEDKSRLSQIVVSQVEYGVLHLVDVQEPQVTVLMDCEGLTPFRFPMQMMRSCAVMLQDHYPNRLAALIVIRLAPIARVIAHTLFQVLRPGTRHKLRIVGDNYQRFLSEYLESLPSVLGGSCSCSNCVYDSSAFEILDKRANGEKPSLRTGDAQNICLPLTASHIDDFDHIASKRVMKTTVVGILLVVLCIAIMLLTYGFGTSVYIA